MELVIICFVIFPRT